MRVAIIASGSRGDVQPYIALGKGLKNAGHVVRLVTHQNFEALVNAHGVAFWPISGNVQDVAQSKDMRERLERGNFLAVMSQMAKAAQRGALALAEGGLAACEGMELVIAGIGGLFVGLALAEKLGLALLQAYYIPFTPTQAYPSFLFPKLPSWFRGRLNRLSYHVVRQIMWQGFRSADRLARQKVLGLPSAPFWGPYGADCLRHYTVFMVDSIPFSWLFSRVAAVVHHGGAGTTSAGLRAGVPSVVIPFFGDQPFWGQRVAELGGGPEPIPRRKLTVERLAQAIQRAVTDQTMRQRAAELGARIRAEDGVACAVDVVQRIKG